MNGWNLQSLWSRKKNQLVVYDMHLLKKPHAWWYVIIHLFILHIEFSRQWLASYDSLNHFISINEFWTVCDCMTLYTLCLFITFTAVCSMSVVKSICLYECLLVHRVHHWKKKLFNCIWKQRWWVLGSRLLICFRACVNLASHHTQRYFNTTIDQLQQHPDQMMPGWVSGRMCVRVSVCSGQGRKWLQGM